MGLLDGKVCLVSGAGQGLGRAISLRDGAEGAAVVLLERNGETVAAVAAGDCKGRRDRASLPTRCDGLRRLRQGRRGCGHEARPHRRAGQQCRDQSADPHASSTTRSRTGGAPSRSISKPSTWAASWWRRTWSRSKSGRIIHVASIQGFASSGATAAPTMPPRAASSPTRSRWRWSSRRYNILVNAVAPGFMVTPMSVVNGVDETTTPDFIDWYVDTPQDSARTQRLAGGCLRHRGVSRVGLLPLHDGPAAGRRWRLDEHVLKSTQEQPRKHRKAR